MMADRRFPCQQCSLTYKTLASLKEHVKDKHGTERYVCDRPECGGQEYRCKRNLEAHIRRIHEGEKRYVCTLCGVGFFVSTGLAVHLRRAHTGEKPFRCTQCEKSFASPEHRQLHLRTHSGIKPHSCTFCDKLFLTPGQLTVHLRGHTGEEPFKCPHCEQSFRHDQLLKDHIVLRHGGEKRFACTFCSYKTMKSGQLRGHLRSAHTREKPFRCNVCGASYTLNGSLTCHMAAKHANTGLRARTLKKKSKPKAFRSNVSYEHLNEDGQQVKCGNCGVVVGDRKQKRWHTMKYHPKERNFVCSLCDKSFASQGTLTNHIKYHTGEKPLACSRAGCEKKFATRSCLTEHEMTHQGGRVKKFGCEWCPKKFRVTSLLQRHRLHCTARPGYYEEDGRERPFECSKCRKRYLTKYHLNYHLKASASCSGGTNNTLKSLALTHARQSNTTNERERASKSKSRCGEPRVVLYRRSKSSLIYY